MLAPGQRLGPYELVAAIGEGGMGEVWKARDTRLGRTVAVKVSKAAFSERFEREAGSVASLSHPNICTLHDVGPDYLVMEYIEGKPVKGPLPVETALRYAVEIAKALDAAHRIGIVHRDLKPGNILVTKSGIKLLDFGLAKMTATASASEQTVTMALTEEGTILGTLQYMAPEQLEGKEADARSDIFAFGCVLYEMLTGAPAFQGGSRASIVAAIMNRELKPLPGMPPALASAIHRCLLKDPDDRWQSARDLRAVLELAGIPSVQPVAGNASPRARWLLVLLPLAALLLVVAWPRRNAAVQEPVAFTIPPPEKTTLVEWPGVPSPDGRLIALVAKDESGKIALWLRPLAALAAQSLPGTDDASGPFWSPDGHFLGFFAQGKLKKIAAAGGPVQNVCNAAVDLGATWNSGGDIVMAPSNRVPLYRVSASGGIPQPITSLNTQRGENSHRWPHFLPDGNHFLFTARSNVKENSAIYVGSLDSKAPSLLLPAQSNAEFAAPGLLLFGREGTLMAHRFSARKLALDGDAFPVAGGVWQVLPSERTLFSVSSNGRVLAYLAAEHHQAQLVWFDRAGANTGIVGTPGDYTQPRLSPDGKRVAVTVADPESGNRDIWLMDVASGRSMRFTFDPANDWQPAWSPDGAFIAFASDRTAPSKIYRKASNGAGEEELLLARTEGGVFPRDWSKDGRALLFNQNVEVGNTLWILPMSGERIARPLDPAPTTSDARFSLDGRWVAYASGEGGTTEVFVRPADGGEKIRVSTAGGKYAAWGKSGREITYVGPDDFLMSVPVTPGKTFAVGTPKPLFRMCSGAHTLRGDEMFYDVAPDGNRFLVNCAASETGKGAIHVMLEWQSGVKD